MALIVDPFRMRKRFPVRKEPVRHSSVNHYGNAGGGGNQLPLVISDADAVVFTGAQARAGQWIGTHNLRSPVMLWHNGKTYSCYPGPGDGDGFNQAYIIVYDENNGIGRPFRVGNILDEADGHSVPTMWINNKGVYVFQEHTHDTNIHIYHGQDFNNMDLLSEQIGEGQSTNGQLSYNHFFVDDNGNAITWCRHVRSDFSYSGNHGAVVKASDGFESWGTVVRIATNPRPQQDGDGLDNRTRLYPVAPYYRQKVGEYWYLMHVLRNEDNAEEYGENLCWQKYYIYRTTDFITFENVIGDPYSHNTSGGNYLTETVMDEHFLLYNSGSTENNAQIPVLTIGPHGEVYCVTGIEDTGSLQLHIVKNRTYTAKPLGIDNVVNTHPGQSHRCWHLAAFSQYIEVAALISGDKNKIHLFRSEDDGDTWEDLGDITPEFNDSVTRVVFPMNYHDIPNGRNFVVQIHADDSDNLKKVLFKRVSKGAIKTESPTVVIPSATLSDGYNVFRYRATDDSIVRSGNNVSQLTDMFGLRNATAVNNPQWDGDKQITLNGSDNYFTIPVDGIDFSKLTLFAIVKSSGSHIIIVDISDNNKTGDFFTFHGYHPTPSSARVTSSANGLVYNEDGQTNTGDGVFHIITFVVDGRCKFDIYVDGLKQYYGTGARYNQRGKILFSPNTIRIGSRDISGTDSFTPLIFRELLLKGTIYTYSEQRSIERKLADDHGITLDYGYL